MSTHPHDRDFMDSVTTHTMAIHRMRMRKIAGSTHKLYEQIIEEEEIYEQTRPMRIKAKEIEIFINRFRAQATRARSVQSRIRQLQKKEKMEKLSTLENLEFSFNTAPFPGRWLLEADGVNFSYVPGGPEFIRDFTIAVKKRNRIGIIEERQRQDNASQRSGWKIEARYRHDHVQPKPENGIFRSDECRPPRSDITIEDEIWSVEPSRGKTAVRGICGAMMFDGDKAMKKVGVLSGGEKSRVLLGKLIAEPANLLLLDEPTNHLDIDRSIRLSRP